MALPFKTNYKNQLQEYRQREKLSLPNYQANIVDGPPHAPIWIATVDCGGFQYASQRHASRRDAEQDAARCAHSALLHGKHEVAMGYKSNYESNIVYDLAYNLVHNPSADLAPNPPHFLASSKNVLRTEQTDTEQADNGRERQPSVELKELPDTSSSTPANTQQLTYILIDLENIQPTLPLYLPSNIIVHCFLSSYSSIDTDKYKHIAKINVVDSGITDAADHYITFYAGELSGKVAPSTKFILLSRDKTSDVLAMLLREKGFIVDHFKKAKDLEAYLGN